MDKILDYTIIIGIFASIAIILLKNQVSLIN